MNKTTLVTWGDDPDASNTFVARHIPEERCSNGAAKPWFQVEEASRIAEIHAVDNPSSSGQYRWNKVAAGFEVDAEDDPGVERWTPVPTMVTEDGFALYEMGAGWTWREVDGPEDEEDPAWDEWKALATKVYAAVYLHSREKELHYPQGVF